MPRREKSYPHQEHQTSAQVDDELLEHLTDLYNWSTPELNDRDKCHAKQLLVEYHDISSKHDLNFCCLISVNRINIPG